MDKDWLRTRRKQLLQELIELEEMEDKEAGPTLEDRIRQWRKQEATRRRIPAYMILRDDAITELALNKPTTIAKLLTIRGLGQKIVDKDGLVLLQLINQDE